MSISEYQHTLSTTSTSNLAFHNPFLTNSPYSIIEYNNMQKTSAYAFLLSSSS